MVSLGDKIPPLQLELSRIGGVRYTTPDCSSMHVKRGWQMAEFTSDMLIRDVLNHSPATATVFERHGLACASCMGSQLETVSAVASVHDVDVSMLLVELNALSTDRAEEE